MSEHLLCQRFVALTPEVVSAKYQNQSDDDEAAVWLGAQKCVAGKFWNGLQIRRDTGVASGVLSVMQYGFLYVLWMRDLLFFFFVILTYFLVSLCRPNKDFMANFPDRIDILFDSSPPSQDGPSLLIQPEEYIPSPYFQTISSPFLS